MFDIVVDYGNTRIKIGIIKNKLIHQIIIIDENNNNEFKQEISKLSDINACLLSTVVEINDDLLDFIKQKCNFFIELTHNTLIPITNKYLSPETLGKDRLASVIGAAYLYPDQNNLVIDLGTCIKYDLITSSKEYFGGAISPGLQMRFQSLNEFTNKLPLLKPEEINYYLGSNTSQSILSGVINGITLEIKGFIDYYKKDYENLRIILTGGDAFFFEKILKNIIFANSNLVIIGLNEILQYNVYKTNKKK